MTLLTSAIATAAIATACTFIPEIKPVVFEEKRKGRWVRITMIPSMEGVY